MKKWLWLGAAVFALIVFVGLTARARRAELALEKVQQVAIRARLEAIAADERYGATLGQLKTEKQLVAGLTAKQLELLRAMKRVDPGARVDSVSKTTVAISDTTPGHTTQKPGLVECLDDYHRFHVIIPSTGECAVERRQLFQMSQVFIRSTDGKTRLGQGDFKEFDPQTKEMIPATGVDMKVEFTFADELPPKPPILHLRPLAGIDHRTGIAAGAEFLNLERTEKPILERLTAAGMAYWKSDTDLRLGLRAGYRLFGNVSLGGYYAWQIPKLTPAIGADVTVRLGN